MTHKILLSIVAFFITTNVMAQNENFKTLIDPKDKTSEMLVGYITAADIKNNASCDWFEKGVAAYTPDSNVVKILKKVVGPYKFVILAGTWCGDTQFLLPQFFKTANVANIKTAQIEMYGVDRSKKALNAEHLIYDISKVPTIIIYNGPHEIGRIVESTKKENIELDILFYIQNDIEAIKANNNSK
jgi:thiol-disulfide isomerase/thioredoxin